MAKIMLVEDDNNLREIYEARLLAEGYEIVSAKDGEEALAMAVKEKPDLIISDVMMPKISGFDMLDILRSTPETKNTKVIMMTALSQAEDKARADKLGADRYLVKSQVTLEDVAKVARDVLEGKEEGPGTGNITRVSDTTSELAPTTDTSLPVTDSPASEPTVIPTVPEPVVIATDPISTATDDTNSTTTPATDIPPVASDPPVVPVDPVIPTPVTPDTSGDPASQGADDDSPKVEAASAAATSPASTIDPTLVSLGITDPVSSDLTQTSAAEAAEIDQEIHKIIGNTTDQPAPADPPLTTIAPAANPVTTPLPPATQDLMTSPEPSPTPAIPVAATPVESITETAKVVTDAIDASATLIQPTSSQTPQTPPAEPLPVSIAGKKVITPLTDAPEKPDLNSLLAKEAAKEAVATPPATTVISPTTDSQLIDATDSLTLPAVEQPTVTETVAVPVVPAPPVSAQSPDSPSAPATVVEADDPNSIAL